MRLRNRSRQDYAWLLVVISAAVVSVGLVGWTLLNQSDSVRRGYTQLVGPAKANALALATKYALEAADRAVAGATEAMMGGLNTGQEPLGNIPPILHQIFLDGEAQYQKEAASNTTKFLASWRDTCKEHHQDWQYMWWDMAAARAFLQEHFAWFLPTFDAYPKTVLKGDALRPFLLYHYGGVYLDLDCECFRPMTAWINKYNLVLQSEYATERDIVNAVMASAPQHRYWKLVIRIMMRRAEGLRAGANGVINPMTIIGSTGPGVTTLAFKQFAGSLLHEYGSFVGDWMIKGTRARVYGLGDWFVPCVWDDHACHTRTVANARRGIIPLSLAGYHHYAGSWLHTARPPPSPAIPQQALLPTGALPPIPLGALMVAPNLHLSEDGPRAQSPASGSRLRGRAAGGAAPLGGATALSPLAAAAARAAQVAAQAAHAASQAAARQAEREVAAGTATGRGAPAESGADRAAPAEGVRAEVRRRRRARDKARGMPKDVSGTA
eukprot:jgi/Botrbrau1/11021/Bobra.101_1s0019.1